MSQFRHEYKYYISDIEAEILKQRLSAIMSIDNNAYGGFYHISSLYFDDYCDSCLNDNINGVDPRAKIRIRTYNGSDDFRKLEYKRKQFGMIQKESFELSMETYKYLVERRYYEALTNTPRLDEIIMNMQLRNMRPVVIVSYDRIPFVYKMGNVRITLDYNITSSTEISSFAEGSSKSGECRSVLPIGYQILEVKWDELIPDYVFRVCQLDNLTQTAFSKYALCRRII